MMFNFQKTEFLKNGKQMRNENNIILKKSLKTNILIELQRPGTFLTVESSTSSPGGNQVDDLPPASSTRSIAD